MARVIESMFAGVSFLIMFLSDLRVGEGQPLCLDFRPPFTPVGGLHFCTDYSDFGCCSRADDDRIRDRYNRSLSIVTNANCAARLKTLLCLECSPLAVHLYDAETTTVKRPFPVLCDSYCRDVHRSCASIVPLITNSTEVLGALRKGESRFCSAIKTSNTSFCYPDVLNSPEFNPNQTLSRSTTEGCLCLRKFAGNLRNPLILLSADDGSGRIFVGEQLGLVHIYHKNGTRNNESFLDISDVVLTSDAPAEERGFLGMAFHPQFRTNQKFYVYYSIRTSKEHFRNRVSEFTTSADNRDTINRTSERVLLELDKPFDNHNGGQVNCSHFK